MNPVYTAGRWQVDLERHELRADGLRVPIGMRAFEIIEVLVRSAGKLVTKDDLMRAVWRGAIVEEATLWVHISAIRKALGTVVQCSGRCRAMAIVLSGTGQQPAKTDHRRTLGMRAWTCRRGSISLIFPRRSTT
jgi:hypothetical protein